jgi:hypothetical protein
MSQASVIGAERVVRRRVWTGAGGLGSASDGAQCRFFGTS